MSSSFSTSLRVLIAVAAMACAAPALARVWFVDNARPQTGNGTLDAPLTTLAAAQSASGPGDVIFVAETSQTYAGGIALERGQLLVGAAYGLDALRADFGIDLPMPHLPAAQGPGPSIEGVVSAAGDNVIAGCTIVGDRVPGLVVTAPQGKVTVRNVWFRPTHDAFAVSLRDADFPVEIAGGGIILTEQGSGISVSGGRGAVTIKHCPLSGAAGVAVAIGGRIGGDITFEQGSPVKIDDASREGIAIRNVRGVITFADGFDVATRGGRGLVIAGAQKVVARAEGSRIAAVNGTAIDIRDAEVDLALERVTARGEAPGRLSEGIILNKLRGHLAIAGGEIRGAQQYGVRVEQSAGVKLAAITVASQVAASAPCAERPTNLLCHAALYLRHVSDSLFQNLTLESAASPALNGNNLENVTFAEIHLRGGGVLFEQLKGNIVFEHCTVLEGAVTVDQRFGAARVILDGTTIAAPERPAASPFLLRARTSGAARLELAARGAELHDNAGGAIRLDAADDSVLSFVLSDASAQRFGGRFLEATARQSSRIDVAVQRARIIAPGARDALMLFDTAGSATACAETADNRITADPGTLPVELRGRAMQCALR